MRMVLFFSALAIGMIATPSTFAAPVQSKTQSRVQLQPATTIAETNYGKRGYHSCVVTQERRAVVENKEICVLAIECEANGKDSVPTSAVCKPYARNNRCPEARDCLTDDTVTEMDYSKKTGEYIARESKDACFQPSATAQKFAAMLKSHNERAVAEGKSSTPATEPSRAPANTPEKH